MIVQVCVGSSCHLKGSMEIVEFLRTAIESNNIGDEVTLAGSFCTGVCNRVGVTIIIDDATHTGVTPADIKVFFKEKILDEVMKGR